MTEKSDNENVVEVKRQKSIRLLLWLGVMVPLAFSVIIGLLETGKFKAFVSTISSLYVTIMASSNVLNNTTIMTFSLI